jgi:hypothetical protein
VQCGPPLAGGTLAIDGNGYGGAVTVQYVVPGLLRVTGSAMFAGRELAVDMELGLPGAGAPCVYGSGAGAGMAVFADAVPAPSPLGTDLTYARNSTQCTGSVLFDGWVSSKAYLFLRTGSAGTAAALCVRLVTLNVDGVAPAYFGGMYVVRGPTVSNLLIPSVTTDPQTCTSPGNEAPGPHPLLNGFLGDPDEATYVPYMIDTYSRPGIALFCVQLGTARLRITIPTQVTARAPDATFFVDPGVLGPSGPVPPPSTASGECWRSGTVDELANFDINGGHLWLATSTGSPSPVRVCVRVDSSTDLGGHVSVSTSGATPPSISIFTDTAPCTSTIAQNTSPVFANVSRSPTGVTPVSLCVTIGTSATRVTVTPMSGGVPSVTWVPDPGTPG